MMKLIFCILFGIRLSTLHAQTDYVHVFVKSMEVSTPSRGDYMTMYRHSLFSSGNSHNYSFDITDHARIRKIKRLVKGMRKQVSKDSLPTHDRPSIHIFVSFFAEKPDINSLFMRMTKEMKTPIDSVIISNSFGITGDLSFAPTDTSYEVDKEKMSRLICILLRDYPKELELWYKYSPMK